MFCNSREGVVFLLLDDDVLEHLVRHGVLAVRKRTQKPVVGLWCSVPKAASPCRTYLDVSGHLLWQWKEAFLIDVWEGIVQNSRCCNISAVEISRMIFKVLIAVVLEVAV